MKTVSRAYGGMLCAEAVRMRILRSFLTDEQRMVAKVAKERSQKKLTKADDD